MQYLAGFFLVCVAIGAVSWVTGPGNASWQENAAFMHVQNGTATQEEVALVRAAMRRQNEEIHGKYEK
jgi:hypothetical protein